MANMMRKIYGLCSMKNMILAIVDAGGILYRKWNPTHGTDINDALLAATVKLTGGKIYGLNKKHYPMPEVIFEKPY